MELELFSCKIGDVKRQSPGAKHDPRRRHCALQNQAPLFTKSFSIAVHPVHMVQQYIHVESLFAELQEISETHGVRMDASDSAAQEMKIFAFEIGRTEFTRVTAVQVDAPEIVGLNGH